MSDALDKIITKPDGLKGNLEYAIALPWEETDREDVADLAAVELSELREENAAQKAELNFYRSAFPRAAQNYADVKARHGEPLRPSEGEG